LSAIDSGEYNPRMPTVLTPRVALFGLGIMGGGMARRLLGAGIPLTVFNRHPDKAAALAAQGAAVASTPREAAVGASIAISMVADDGASRSIWLGSDGALEALEPGALLIESSTLTVGWIRELAEAATARGCELLDAPVTGSKMQAAAGELTFLVGGSAAALERARPILAAMGNNIVPVGPTGSGALLKLINNFLCGIQAVSVGEALAVIENSGLDRDKAIEFLSAAAPGSPILKTMFARMTGDLSPNFRMALMAKDMEYAIKEGDRYGVSLTTAALALSAFTRAMAAGHGDRDFAAVAEPIRRQR
jgi:3-hydroxyisobutyrate dehydrogenase